MPHLPRAAPRGDVEQAGRAGVEPGDMFAGLAQLGHRARASAR
jgi:hypothetical protein